MPSIDTTPSRPVAVRRAPKVAVLQASNAAVCQRDGDRQYGSLLVGGQGSGKTSVELRMYLNDVHDPNAAVIDSPYGQGHVVLFSNNPMWRAETKGSYFLVFNAILNFDSLNAGRKLADK